MRRTPYDPLTHIPSPDVVRRHLAETEDLARRLRILLQVSEAVREPQRSDDVGQRQGAFNAK
jgi:hypothetical protein